MTTENNRQNSSSSDSRESRQTLRWQAEERIREKGEPDPENFSPDNIRRLLHELRVHQIELEMQNEELRRVQEALEISRSRYFDLYDLAPVGYITLCENALIQETNLRAALLLDAPRSALIKQPLSRLVLPDDQDIYYLCRKRLLATSKPQACELRLLRQGGTAFWAHLETAIDRDGDGPVVRVILSDIGERKEAEEQLRIAAAVFESHEGTIVTDAANVILRVNKAFTAITGYAAEEAVGRTPSILQSGRQDTAFYRRMWEALRSEDHWEGEIWNRRKDGGVYPEWLVISAIRNPRGEISHYVGVFSDISESREAQRKILELAYYDPLTSLPNRRLLLDRLGQALASSARTREFGALLLLDLDRFKTLNDSRGHDVGDLLLMEVAKRLLLPLRVIDTAARLGGDEFVVLLENLSEDELDAAGAAEAVAEKLRASLGQPCVLKNESYHITPSIGIALFNGHGENAESLLKHASKEHRKRGSDSGRTECDDPRVAVGPDVLSESER
ncbi:MAG TPA: diguanylate cyclase [Methylococcaceae bacterium]|nr:diguanylate cyclase [Methylococcaceae bacterium]